jgi:hypothetical protein
MELIAAWATEPPRDALDHFADGLDGARELARDAADQASGTTDELLLPAELADSDILPKLPEAVMPGAAVAPEPEFYPAALDWHVGIITIGMSRRNPGKRIVTRR